MNEEYLIDLMAKKTSGVLTEDEQRELDKLIETPELKALHDQLSAAWADAARFRPAIAVNTDRSWIRFNERLKETRTRVWMPYLLRIAAVLIVALGVGYLFFVESPANNIVFETTANEKIEIDLPDGTRVWLNENSRLSYGEDYNAKERHVAFSGEAFFDVVRNEQRTFRIETGESVVEVLGTSFDVDAYPAKGYVAVDVKTGRVALRSKGEAGEIIIEKGAYGKLDLDRQVLGLAENAPLNIDYWRTGQLIFEDVPLSQVIADLNKNFDLPTTVSSPTLGECRFTSSFNHPSLEEVLEIISITMSLTVEKTSSGFILIGESCQSN